MKVVGLSAVLLAAIGCASADGGSSESQQDRLTKLEVQMTQKMDKAHAVYTDLIESVLKLERRVATLENQIDVFKIDIKKLQERLDQGGGSPKSGSGPAPDAAEVGMRIDQSLAKLKTT